MSIRIGTSGWSYPHWNDVLYTTPHDRQHRLERYVQEFPTVELNGSFYRWPGDRAFAAWRESLPEGFTMAVKAPRGLTHAKRLREPEAWVERIRSSLHELGDRRGMFLVQLPPDLARDDARLDHFLGALPEWLQVAVEFRHDSWHVDEVFALLERHGAAYCVMSGAGQPCILRATAPTVYVRMHGPDHEHLYAGSYSDADLAWWADRCREWQSSGHDVLVYFNNDGAGHAVRNARTLQHLTENLD
ncbi:DUF72 domain-containing protein [Herbiconiux sp. CPCC 203407]|uniref:DUF72 domain-containing protein n=1 Tax=Herbiconiux oxytropis TaxID=2970915 RepID=A0AA41XEE1_9MICO|nr:DUF72 domain-containing protein [Herbiconiux oxytropis]MCS5721727.1 DUF72 domain-containing protein [Herbiconiux oxytropis]MCS5726646.1 DUF72 domain-containing protein [Herbiconiux oxytropis]